MKPAGLYATLAKLSPRPISACNWPISKRK